DSDTQHPVPIFSAGMGFITPFEGGQPHLDPLISPIFLIPIGDRWLIESRDTFESDLSTPPGSDTFRGVVQKEVDYFIHDGNDRQVPDAVRDFQRTVISDLDP